MCASGGSEMSELVTLLCGVGGVQRRLGQRRYLCWRVVQRRLYDRRYGGRGYRDTLYQRLRVYVYPYEEMRSAESSYMILGLIVVVQCTRHILFSLCGVIGTVVVSCQSQAYIVVGLYTELMVCDLAFHTSLSDSHVTHSSFFSLQ